MRSRLRCGRRMRPQYYGMRLAQRFAGATFVSVALAGNACEVTAYAARMENAMLVALVNKSGSPVQVKLRGSAARASECWMLTASSIDAKDGVRFAQTSMDERVVPAYAAALWKLPLMRARNG